MPDALVLTHALLVVGDPGGSGLRRIDDGWIAVADGEVTAVGAGDTWRDASTGAEIVDAGGGLVCPAFTDIHCHGAGGAAFDDGPEATTRALAVHRDHGTAAHVLSFVTAPIEELCARLARAAAAMAQTPGVLGFHAEGPFLAPSHKGAHDETALVAPTPERVEAILAAADGRLAQVTIAPELPEAMTAIDTFVAAGVRVAVGHTDADYATTREAIERGASLLTHAFNAMNGLHHRRPGPVAAALDAGIDVELIADGVHVHAPLARLLFTAAPGRVVLVTDAMSATDVGDGDYVLGSLPVVVTDGTARLRTPDGSTGAIAGSTLTMDRAIARTIALGIDPVTAVEAATTVPRRALGLPPEPLLVPGAPARLVQFDATGALARVVL